MDVRTMLSNKLKYFRERSTMTLDEVGTLVGKSGKTISAWEKGRGQPDADMLIRLCEVFEVESINEFFNQPNRDSVPSREGLHIGRLYDKAEKPHKKAVELILEPYDDRQEMKNMPRVIKTQDAEIAEELAPKFIKIRHYTETAAAGLGDYLTGEAYDMVEYPEDIVPYGTDYTVKISGDSMEPTIKDGAIAFVKECVEVQNGNVGIFIVDNNSFCKELRVDSGNNRIILVSHNDKYPDMTIDFELRDFRTVGRVLGTAVV